jgi:hypothetical protein
VPDVVNTMRLAWFLLALSIAFPAPAQLPVADLRASHVVLTEVPTLRFADWPPLTPSSIQVVRVRLENRGPADVPDANARFSPNPGFLTPALVEMSVPSTCGVVVTAAATYSIDWPIGLLRPGEHRECDFTLRATGLGPMTPPPNGSATFVIIPTSVATAPPPPGITFTFAAQRFTVSPATAVLADYSVRIEPSPVRIDPGTSQDVSIFITNHGPQAVTPSQTALFGWFDRYNRFGPPPSPPDPFLINPFVLPGCRFQEVGPIISPPRDVELTAIVEQTIAPGETRECRIRVEARPSATGERSLRFTQRIFYDGVVDPNLADNVATLRMIFSDPPAQSVPTASKTMLAVLGWLLALIGIASFARSSSNWNARP